METFIGKWIDQKGAAITISGSGTAATVNYNNGRGPFQGTLNTSKPLEIIVNFTDDGGNKTGILSADGSKISWSNGTSWANFQKQTNFILTNNTNEGVQVYLTLGTVTGCVQHIGDIPFIAHTVNPLQGWFNLAKNQSVSYTPPYGMGFNGNISFGTPPINCPTPAFPNGVNLGEFMLNNAFQSNGNETIDISCVAGVNALLEYELQGGGNWNASAAYPNVTDFKNKAIGDNVGQIGVYPYMCDDCTKSVSPPVCSGSPIVPIVPQTSPICNVQRVASTFGGTVTLKFNGFVS